MTQSDNAVARPLWSSTAGIGLILTMLLMAGGIIGSRVVPVPRASADYWPFAVLVISIAVVIILITFVRAHAFLALILAAITAGLAARSSSLPPLPKDPPPAIGKDPAKTAPAHAMLAVERTAWEFGKACGGIGIVIMLAAIIGMALLESGAADRVVRTFLRAFGEKHAGLALLLSTYVVSIPIFFDTIFMLLIPLARALRLRTGKDYLLYVLAICCAGVITHSLVIPHPGPLAMVDNLKLDAGLSIFVGLATGIPALFAGWLFCLWINKRMDIPLTEAPGATLADLRAIMDRPESSLPSFGFSIAPVLLPVCLIWIGSLVQVFAPKMPGAAALMFLGERHVALFIATILSLAVLIRQRALSLAQTSDMLGQPLETAGVIIFITAAGGAFGAMLKNAGVGNAITSATQGYSINLVLLSFLIAFVIRIAQGSATVAMLTTSSIVAPMVSSLPHHPIYLFVAIGFGAMACSWMNDSGFWVVSRLGGLTEKQTLRSWTILLTVVSFAGMLTALILSKVLPLPIKVGT